MAKSKKRSYYCQSCGSESAQWSGQCHECHAWNSLAELQPARSPSVTLNRGEQAHSGYAGQALEANTPVELQQVVLGEIHRIPSGLTELDRVLGGGIVEGSVVLLGGDPGIGKSTLLLQVLSHLSATIPSLYITGEESLQQVAMRAKRLGLSLHPTLQALIETQVESIIAQALQLNARILVVDSIQTMYTETHSGTPGTISQLRESTGYLTRYAKQNNMTIFLIGHVNKEGTLAGPRVLEHMVDTVLYFEGDPDQKFRLIRTVKNRFGPANELGVFAMTEKGLREVQNPSAIFLSRPTHPVPGSLVMPCWKGSRPLLVELQALVDTSHLSNPRRVTIGLDHHRLSMLLAVLHRHTGIKTYDQDVFLNLVGGMQLEETSADLPILLTILSSLRNKPLDKSLIAFGEVGLAGEIRPVTGGQERLHVAAKQGFTQAIIPQKNVPKQLIKGLTIIPISHLSEILERV